MPGFTSYSLSRKINLTKVSPVRAFYHMHLDSRPSSLYDCIMKIGMMADTYKPYVSGVTNYIA
jgi:hypothetical protein